MTRSTIRLSSSTSMSSPFLAETRELDVDMNAEQREVLDEFLPELVSEEEDDDQEENKKQDAEDRERDSFIKRLQNEVKEFGWRLFGISTIDDDLPIKSTFLVSRH